MVRLETTILKNLIQNEEFTRKCIPFLKPEYFTDTTEKTIFEEVYAYFQKYTKPPTKEALLINLDNSTSINENVVKDAKNIVGKFEVDNTPQDWLVDESLDQELIVSQKQEYDDKKELLESAMKILNEREKEIITARRLSEEPETLEDLSKKYKISRERVRQIENKAFEKLQKHMLLSAKSKNLLPVN